MKKIILLILIIISAVCAFAQDNIVRENTEWTYYWRDPRFKFHFTKKYNFL